MIGILAGSGKLAYEVAAAAQAKSGVFVVAVSDDVDKRIKQFPHAQFSLLQVNGLIKKLKEEKCKKLVLIGSVARPAASAPHLDQDLIADIPAKLIAYGNEEAVRQKHHSDDALLASLIRYLEKDEGFEIVAAEKICPSLAAQKGFVAKRALTKIEEEDIKIAARMARLFGKQGVGQSVVVCRGLILAVEAVEGTDAMLRRISDVPEALRGTKAHRAGVLMKLPRQHQDKRVDLPTIGPETVAHVEAAGLAGIVVEQGSALIYDREQIAKDAEAAGIFVQVIGRR